MVASESYEQRHARAVESFRIFTPDVEPERVARSAARRLGALGSFMFDTVGELWTRPGLTRRDRSIVVLSALAAQARDEELEIHVANGLRHGLTRVEIEELLLHVAAYAGFPAALASSRHVDAALRRYEGLDESARLEGRVPAAQKSDEERDRDGADVIRTIRGLPEGDPATSVDATIARLGGVGELAHRWAFGEIWCRPELSRRDRSLSVISILVWLGAHEELAVHTRAGRNHGLTREEIEEAVTHLALYAGFPRSVSAMRVVRSALADQ